MSNVIPFRPKAKLAAKQEPRNTTMNMSSSHIYAVYALAEQTSKMLGISFAEVEQMLMLQFKVKSIDMLLESDFPDVVDALADLQEPEAVTMH